MRRATRETVEVVPASGRRFRLTWRGDKVATCDPAVPICPTHDLTQVSDAGLEHLKRLTRPARLYLSGTQVADAGLGHLKELTGLRKLDLRLTQVTDVGADELGKALPDCRVYR